MRRETAHRPSRRSAPPFHSRLRPKQQLTKAISPFDNLKAHRPAVEIAGSENATLQGMSLWSRLERKLGDLAGELVLDDYRDQLNQARTLLAKGDLTAATESLEALLAAKPDHGQALIVLGEARLALRDPQHAHEAFERALVLRGSDPAALVGCGLALVELGRYEAATPILNRAIGEAGGDRGILADAYRGLGIAWRRRGDLDKAIRELRKAVVEDSEDFDARAALG